jgi:eukaryotic-like serine/threonine-protein kinase
MLPPGTRLGSFEILTSLGAGGMGEVYRARDSKLNRDVAIKVLLPAVATDPDRLTRFGREAQVLASLNHPNIAHVHGLEESSGVSALVMELVEGPTLADRIAAGRIPADEAVAIASQIADALEAAHERGVIHRDLKPANIKVRPDGTVKVLDFGLAKAIDPATSSASASMSPTLSIHATQAGIILGTAAYMSPEQARGKAVDRRADIWAFGCVLFEMLAGRRAFHGDDISTTLAAVLKDDPNWTLLPAETAPHVRTLLRRCLQKDPRDRLRDAGDVRLLLLDTAAGPTETAARSRAGAWWFLAVALVVAAVACGVMRPVPRTVEPIVLSALLPEGAAIARDAVETLVSPDGRHLAAAVSDASGVTRIWIRDLGRDEGRALAATDGAAQPFWSPDSTRLGFFARGKLKTITLPSGSIDELCDAPLARGAAWGDGVIVLQPRSTGPLMRIPDRGGPLVETTVLATSGQTHRFPSFLPDGRHFVYSVTPNHDYINDIEVGTVDGGLGRKVEEAVGGAVYAAPGYLLFFHDSAVRARRFDPASRQPSGPALALPSLGFISLNADGAP